MVSLMLLRVVLVSHVSRKVQESVINFISHSTTWEMDTYFVKDFEVLAYCLSPVTNSLYYLTHSRIFRPSFIAYNFTREKGKEIRGPGGKSLRLHNPQPLRSPRGYFRSERVSYSKARLYPQLLPQKAVSGTNLSNLRNHSLGH